MPASLPNQPTASVSSRSRYQAVARRQRLKSAVVKGSFFLSASALVVGLSGCGTNDAEVLSATTSGDTETANDTQATTVVTDTTDTTSVPAETTTATATASGDTLSANASMQIDFTFAASGSGRVKNPYMAVWIEDADGNLVDTVGLWYRTGKGNKWLNDLTRWYQASDSGTNAEALTSGTQSPGAYSLQWDGTDADGNKVAAGEYYVCIEAAREHGPYELIREAVALGSDSFDATFSDNQELVGASMSFSA